MQSPCVLDSALFTAADGRCILELPRDAALTPALIDEASESDADAIWLQARAVDSSLGLSQRRGYARLVAPCPPPPVDLARPPKEVIQELESACYRGVWGHAEPGEPDPDATHVALHERGEWVGICEYDATAGWILGPGVKPGLRTPDRYARLVCGASAFLPCESVSLESWGDSAEVIEAYRRLGFAVVEYVPGWELDLRCPETRPR